MRMTLEEIVEDSLLNGYDFQELLSNLKIKKRNIKEYLYGYTLSENKVQYLESMAKNKVVPCDRIRCFQAEIDDLIYELKVMPGTRMISGFFIVDQILLKDGSLQNDSVFKVILVDDNEKSAFVKEIEYIDFGSSDVLCVYRADLDYKLMMDHINAKGVSDLFENLDSYGYVSTEEFEINLPGLWL